MNRCLVQLLLCCLLPAGTALAANAEQRLSSIKQHALALHTISLSDPQRYSQDAIALLRVQPGTPVPLHLRLWIGETLWYDAAPVARILNRGGSEFLGMAPLAAGRHALRAEIVYRTPDQADEFTVRQQAVLELPTWPRGLTLHLSGHGHNVQLRFAGQALGSDLMDAAELALSTGLPGRALIVLKTLGKIDPAMVQDPRYVLLIGRSLRGWGLDTAAESMFAQLASRDAPAELQAEARLQAAELALSRGNLDAAGQHLDWRGWPGAQRGKAGVLSSRLSLAQGELAAAGRNIPGDAPLLWQYNLGIALLQEGQLDAGTELLQQVGRRETADRQSQRVSELANLKLGYWLLQRQRADTAFEVLGRIGQDSPLHTRALLGRGWAALAQLEGQSIPPASTDDPRPSFIQRIDVILSQVDGRARERAVLKAVESWSQLRDGDPLQPAVQEALVAIPYALAQLGADQRAISYAEVAVRRLNATRLGLSRIYTRSVRGETPAALPLSREAWPPLPGAWQARVSHQRWWLDDAPEAPLNAHMHALLTDPQSLLILQRMRVLDETEAMVRAATTAPQLEPRARQLLQQIEAERGLQQKALDRFVWTWLDRMGTRTTRYLILARLTLGQVASREAKP